MVFKQKKWMDRVKALEMFSAIASIKPPYCNSSLNKKIFRFVECNNGYSLSHAYFPADHLESRTSKRLAIIKPVNAAGPHLTKQNSV